MNPSIFLCTALVSLAALGCNNPSPAGSTGGVAASGDASCGHALVVAESDYSSTSIAIVSYDGDVLSPAILSSGSAGAGTSAALSGDVVLPLTTPPSGEIVLIDRYPNGVITWLNPTTGQVRTQLSVRTGFDANPHDYIEVGPNKAYVSRYGSNLNPNQQDFDRGGDLLVIDPGASSGSPRVLGRVDLSMPDDGLFLPRPDRMARLGNQVIVILQRFNANFSEVGPARLVGVDIADDTVAWNIELPGLANCSGVAMSPTQSALALACTGPWNMPANMPAGAATQSGIAILDLTVSPPVEISRFDIESSFGTPPAPSLAFASADLVVGTTYGNFDTGQTDRMFAINVATRELTELLHAQNAFVYGDVRCCDSRCFFADAESIGLRRWDVTGTALTEQPLVLLHSATNLPPRYLGGY
ncbi:MAG: hypothetical protein FWD73_14225 [Polyangiaceae bacterium]|nr:hypothetical protein [Polyangiaceae bacterium]